MSDYDTEDVDGRLEVGEMASTSGSQPGELFPDGGALRNP